MAFKIDDSPNSITRVIHDKGHSFTQITNKLIWDETRLSAKAKGLMMYFLSRPSGWAFNMKDFMKHFSDREASIRTGWAELSRFGYIQRFRKRNKKTGELIWVTLVYEIPGQAEESDADLEQTPEELWN